MIHRYLVALEAFEDILQIDSRLLFQVLQKVIIDLYVFFFFLFNIFY
jgi:hypothetical protein